MLFIKKTILIDPKSPIFIKSNFYRTAIIVDLYCYELNLVIEIDGLYHNNEDKSNSDVLREQELGKYDLTVLRFTEQEVRKDMINVLRAIESYVLEHSENLSKEDEL